MKQLFNRLGPIVKDALTGLIYALLITLILLLSAGSDAGFRYLWI